MIEPIRSIEKPYLLLIGDIETRDNAKTAFGLKDWTPEACLGQLRFTEGAVNIGLPQMTPHEAAAAGAKTLVIGIAPVGGQISENWIPVLVEALEAGLDLAAGLHQRLGSIATVAECAASLGRRIHDVRNSDANFAVGTGLPRSGRRLLTVGTDCALGKKYTALAITRALHGKGIKADFRATGQTGILISGRGIAVDAVVADFVSGAAEALSPANAPGHWDVIEGQGSLFHPGYAGVTLGLLHGSQPDALVLCHKPTRRTLVGFPHVPLVALDRAIPAYEAAARLTNPAARVIGISLDTSDLADAQSREVLRETSEALALPCIDPIRTGVTPIVVAMEKFVAR